MNLDAEIERQGDIVRALKGKKASKDEVHAAVAILNQLKLQRDQSNKADAPAFNRATLDSLLQKRFFYAPSFQIYGGVAGLYDYGPPGCALQANILSLWRQHFVLEEDMLEVECTK